MVLACEKSELQYGDFMSDKKYKKDKDNKKKKIKDKCCEKFVKKGKHCSSCPLEVECNLPEWEFCLARYFHGQ